MSIAFVAARAEQLPAVQTFILDHGANVWNWLPADGITQHLRDIAAGQAHGLLALDGTELVGAVTFCTTHTFARYQNLKRQHALHGYICEAVVRRDQVGRGLGAQLLVHAVAVLRDQGLQEIYVDRHEENAASAGMMRKAGFAEIDSYAEPARRPHGSGRTTVCRMVLSPD
jgi:ribosomal protein S18 acetylase RimI-like enzyme